MDAGASSELLPIKFQEHLQVGTHGRRQQDGSH